CIGASTNNTVFPNKSAHERKSMTDLDDFYDNPSRSSFSRASLSSIDVGDIFATSPPRPHQRMQRRNTTMQIPMNIGHSQAADLHHGEEIQVSSESSSRIFDFDKASVPTVLCMSIWKEMSQNLLVDGDSRGSPRRVNAPKAPGNFEQSNSRNTINPTALRFDDEELEYQLDSCLVDFTSPIDTILIPCGHRCFHSGNLKEHHNITHCPLCRAQIAAVLPIGMMC
ncbi:MAG: hypothetical protein SGBAC_010777, partial [Bacillariaceae sp.]